MITILAIIGLVFGAGLIPYYVIISLMFLEGFFDTRKEFCKALIPYRLIIQRLINEWKKLE